ncbi:helix-turn-helix domain-containing protein [Sphingomicrobium marinum]|uniref:helix-turn-helix domain-containing protein n=1 Tax=Sphingomicrobium marinum TaxID=1227950 RepID=UPI002240B48E|nr:helix-turn-helix domain-containing protein [Sphingomicrobium marinum]
MAQQAELMTMGEFLARYSIGRTTAYREVAAGRLKIRKLGSATRIAREDADAWMASLPVRGGAAA